MLKGAVKVFPVETPLAVTVLTSASDAELKALHIEQTVQESGGVEISKD